VKRKRLNLLAALVSVTTLVSSILPSASVYAAANEPLKLNGKAAASIDLKTGEIIYSQKTDDKMYPASMTKLITALLFAENKQKSDLIKYTDSAKAQPAYSLSTDILRSIKVGDTMTAEDAMKALLLFSANDSAYMIADNVAGDVASFAKMMNDKASKLKMTNSNFVTPNGLHDNNHYTTPYDMLLLQKAAYENPWVKEAMGLKKDGIRTIQNPGQIAYIENRNKLIGKDGNIGGKTGYTTPAGRCLVSIYERDGRSIAAVVMNAAYDAEDIMVFKDMEALANWSFAAQRTPIYQKDSILKTETVTYKPFKFFGPEKTIDIPVILKDEVAYYENDVNKKELKTEISLSSLNPWNLSSDSKIGKLTVNLRNYSKEYDLYTTTTTAQIKAASKGLYIFAGVAVIAVIVIVLLILALIIRGLGRRSSRTRKNKRYKY
jgi:D-alanyl-D-alanine carboxypeptidase